VPHKVDERASRFLDLLARQAADYFERRQAEAALQESERAHAFQSSILTALRDSVWALDAELRILYWNDAATELFGWTADEVPGRNARELFNTLVPGSTREAAVEQLMRTGDFRGEILCRAKDGRTIVCNVTSHVVRGAAGEVSRVVNTARDITERKREECALRDSEEKYRSLFERIDAGFCIVEMIFNGETPVDYRFVEVNPTFEHHTGILNPKGRLMRDIAPDHEQYWFDRYGQVALTGRAQRFDATAKALGDRRTK